MAENLTLEQRADNFLASHSGDAKKAVAALLKDNLKYRKRLREGEGSAYKPDEQLAQENTNLTSENERLQAMIPVAGAVVLTGEDAAAWPKFKALNLAPDKIADAVKERDTLTGRLSERDRADVHTRAAEALGFQPKVFGKVIAAEKLHVEFKDVTETVEGKQVTTAVPHVRPAGDEKAALVPLADYVEKELTDYLPALKADGGTKSGGPTKGVPYPEQKGGSGDLRTTPSHDKLVEAARASGDYQL